MGPEESKNGKQERGIVKGTRKLLGVAYMFIVFIVLMVSL